MNTLPLPLPLPAGNTSGGEDSSSAVVEEEVEILSMLSRSLSTPNEVFVNVEYIRSISDEISICLEYLILKELWVLALHMRNVSALPQ